MIGDKLVGPIFRVGDEVVLAEGTYQGSVGVFLRLREDPNWAEIAERNGAIRSHPVAWLAHSPGLGGLAYPATGGQAGQGDTSARTDLANG